MLDFEGFVQAPYTDMKLLETFIGSSFRKNAKKILRRENCPRVIPPDMFQYQAEEILKSLRNEYKSIFEKMIFDYNEVLHKFRQTNLISAS